jgi:hypothetical protein
MTNIDLSSSSSGHLPIHFTPIIKCLNWAASRIPKNEAVEYRISIHGRNTYSTTKPQYFYWTQSATNNMVGRNGPVILGGIWNAWSNALGREPQIQLDEFFAVPVSVKEEYAKTVPGILRAHEHICAQVRKTIEENNRANALIKFCEPWPDPRYFKLHSICEALIVVFDEYKSVAAEKHADGFRHYDDVAQKQSIILVRTGHENGLSAPTSFESLKDKALPLARSEDMGTIDVIRIPLQVGVHFVANLLLREEAAFPESVMAGPYISREPDHPFMKWEREAQDYGEKRLAHAQAQGKIEPFTTVAAVKNAVVHRRVDIYPQNSMLRFLLSLVGSEIHATLTASYPQSKVVCDKYCFVSRRLPPSNVQQECPR